LPGKPDLTFRKHNTAVFVNGCFWHGHANCKHFRLPKTRTDWWENKITKTQERDAKKAARLISNSWRVAVVWECAINSDLDLASKALHKFIVSQNDIFIEINPPWCTKS
jgi:DNA mismatch endonuclease (patch repair protein)